MKNRKSRKADELLKRLAEATPNDAVKLLFMGGEELSLLDGLDLSLLSEIKRNPNGAVELKFVDRLAVLRELLQLQRAESGENNGENSFYAALDRAAQLLGAEEKDG
ncbi:MAG: XRE family transcriptional regulator [Oscillospiraceae bacterium]|nr:XRE family transcriptional regulator [Oscillospiraceae bacterium]